ncbi:MAG: peroxide stress protein YaaA [Leucothrix sp.]
MLVTLSPSKGQDFDIPMPSADYSVPAQLDQSQLLINELLDYDPEKIGALMSISENLSNLNYQRVHDFHTPFNADNARPALFAFKGDVYSGIDSSTFNEADLAYAQNHLRILSGLYGALRPMDLIQPYRLEMKTKLPNPRGADLYQFWGEKITDSLNAVLAEQKEAVLVNLASNEYYKSVKPKQINGRILNIDFKETKAGKTRIIAFYAKKARGMMADFILRNRIETPEELQAFDTAGYRYDAALSTPDRWTFERIQPEPVSK